MAEEKPVLWARRVVAGTVVVAVLFGAGGYLLGRQHTATPTSTATTTVPAALFAGQGRDWLLAHGGDLTLISTWAKDLADAVQARNARLADLAVREMMIQVGRADGNLPANAFGTQLHQVFLAYIAALNQIETGLVKNDQATFRAGTAALAAAVAQFTTITNLLKVGAG